MTLRQCPICLDPVRATKAGGVDLRHTCEPQSVPEGKARCPRCHVPVTVLPGGVLNDHGGNNWVCAGSRKPVRAS